MSTLAFNDDPPTSPYDDGENNGYWTPAHAKGLFTVNPHDHSGFYMAHSIPKFPYFFNESALNFTIPGNLIFKVKV